MFASCKTGTGNYRLRSGNADNVQGRLLVAFLAVTLRALLESKLKAAGLFKGSSIAEAIVQLGKIKKITFPNGKTVCLEIPKKARLVAQAIGLPGI